MPDPDDRHVLAAAIHAGAASIVTFNLKDFPAERLAPFGVEAVHPDRFVAALISERCPDLLHAFKTIRARLKRPPYSPRDLIAELRGQGLPTAAGMLEPHAASI